MSDGPTTSVERTERLRTVSDVIRKARGPFAPSAGSAHLTIGAQLQRAAELLKTDRLYKEDAEHIQRLSEQANRMRIALLHLWQVSSDPTKTGRYLTIQDREIIADALKDATAQNNDSTAPVR